jgi:anaerobic ribonucleoside-triphosphate reductase
MVNHSVVMVIHQHESYLAETLKEVAEIFEGIIRWDGRDLSKLKRLMALLRYELVSMPFARGTAAITEWLESALYGYHKIQFQSDFHRMADLEAYVHPFFSDFLDAYNAITILKPS